MSLKLYIIDIPKLFFNITFFIASEIDHLMISGKLLQYCKNYMRIRKPDLYTVRKNEQAGDTFQVHFEELEKTNCPPSGNNCVLSTW